MSSLFTCLLTQNIKPSNIFVIISRCDSTTSYDSIFHAIARVDIRARRRGHYLKANNFAECRSTDNIVCWMQFRCFSASAAIKRDVMTWSLEFSHSGCPGIHYCSSCRGSLSLLVKFDPFFLLPRNKLQLSQQRNEQLLVSNVRQLYDFHYKKNGLF